jgi:dihydrolipoamide dehydrogenase
MAELSVTPKPGSNGSNGYDYDLAVIGAGPGGYVAAIKAAQMGKKTCIIEKENVGGTCLNVGCIPTKTMIKTANLLQETRKAVAFAIDGVEPEKLSVSMPRLQERKRAVVNQLVNGIKGVLRGNNVEVVTGSARFVDAHTLQVGDRRVSAEYVIVATGSQAVIPPFIQLEGDNNLLTSSEALELDHIPGRIAVVGGGVIGVEFAYLLNRLGSKVTVLELMDHILPMVDREVSAMAQERMEKDGIVFHLGAKVRRIKDNTVIYELNGEGKSIQADAVLMAVGRAPNTDGLGAEEIGLEFDRKALKVDETMRTSIPNIYAIGDVNGKVMLAHTASHEGMVALSAIYGGHETMNYDRVPSCIYLNPEIACIGLTEEQARERYSEVKVGKFPLAANGKSLVEGDTDGIFKVVVDGGYGEIVGVHLYGGHVTEMISEIAVAMTGELTVDELLNSVHPHPTVSEALPEAFMAATGRAVHYL